MLHIQREGTRVEIDSQGRAYRVSNCGRKLRFSDCYLSIDEEAFHSQPIGLKCKLCLEALYSREL